MGWKGLCVCVAEVYDLKCYLATVKCILNNNFRTRKLMSKGSSVMNYCDA
jgi:hypothetical protein